MAKESNGSGESVKDREKVLTEAQQRLTEAQEAAAEAGAGLVAARMQNVPEMEVEVLPGQTVSHNGTTYYGEGYSLAPEDHKGNDTLSLDGPTALALMQLGYIRIKGAA